jgi:hypothetical protein
MTLQIQLNMKTETYNNSGNPWQALRIGPPDFPM